MSFCCSSKTEKFKTGKRKERNNNNKRTNNHFPATYEIRNKKNSTGIRSNYKNLAQPKPFVMSS